MTEIARIIDKDKSTVTVLVNKLIRLGYVEKQKDGADNRVNLMAVTQKGEALKPVFISIARKLRALSYKDSPDDERETLIRLLTKINENLWFFCIRGLISNNLPSSMPWISQGKGEKKNEV